MAKYIKCCAICFNEFYSTRIGTAFCSQKCRNKSRSLPSRIKQSLLLKTAGTLRVIETVPKAVRDYIRDHANDKDIETLTAVSGLTKIEVDSLIEKGLKIKREQEIARLDQEFKNEVLPQSLELQDDEMANFKLGEHENDNTNDNKSIQAGNQEGNN